MNRRTVNRIVLPGQPMSDGPTALRPWRDSDSGPLTAICRDPEIVRWTPVPAEYTEAQARSFLLRSLYAIHGGSSAPFAIVASQDPHHGLLGSISLNRISWEHRRADVGYFLSAAARGRGHATRAVGLICGWAFAALGLERIGLLVAVDNVASQRVAERAGFTAEATLRAYQRTGADQQDMIAFARLA